MLIGIVGKPSCGKSTFFRASTLAEAAIAPYPFTTIKPNHGVGFVKVECVDKEFGRQCNPRFGYCLNNWRFVPVDLLDVAGLVPGAHKGLGMGNQFLEDLRPADCLIHVVDISGSVNEKGEPVAPLSYDPLNDIRFLEYELDMWYYQVLCKGWERFARQIVQEKGAIHRAIAKQLSAFKVTENISKEVISRLNLDLEKPQLWNENQLMKLSSELRLATKPILIAANKADIPGARKNVERAKQEFPNYTIIACSAESELALREAAKKELIDYIPGNASFTIKKPDQVSAGQVKALQFIKDHVLAPLGSTGVQQVLDSAIFTFLNYIAIFPGGINKLEDKDGRVLPDCFLLKHGSTALDFAYSLHTDLGDGFIRAIDVKTKRTVGKEHLLKHRDVIEIVSSK